MNVQRTLFAVVVLALTVGCTWAATQASDTTGFAVIPDSEAAQLLGGLGWTCTAVHWEFAWYPCGMYTTEEDCVYWVLQYDVYDCEPALSGECDPDGTVLGFTWGECQWNPGGDCEFSGPDYDVYVYGCEPS